MNKVNVFILLMFYLNGTAQYCDQRLFKAVCNQLIEQDKYYYMKREIKDMNVTLNPATMKETINFSKKMNRKFLKQFEQYNHDQQLQIIYGINNGLIPILPLKDTVHIIDSIGFFIGAISFEKKHHFKLETSKSIEMVDTNNSYIYLTAVRVYKNDLLLSFRFALSPMLFTCFFKLTNKDLVFYKFTNIDISKPIE